MLTHDQWDIVADAYIPILALLALWSLVKSFRNSGSPDATLQTKVLVLSILLVYLLMYLDAVLVIWPRFGLDYSTHAALALALFCFLVFFCKPFVPLLSGSICLYNILLVYQGYHTMWDIVSTAGVTLPGLWIVYLRFTEFKRAAWNSV